MSENLGEITHTDSVGDKHYYMLDNDARKALAMHRNEFAFPGDVTPVAGAGGNTEATYTFDQVRRALGEYQRMTNYNRLAEGLMCNQLFHESFFRDIEHILRNL